ncbi:hypothetical protein N474_19875 [Pseudoalteromonas luteoviolacea CPMOR-2]|uniref:Inner membrane protein YejM N-terminal domain-containing protein n=1 Tax=Pseudoalteromonas luteoviolacea DSM 6061 TaxID=1365250 RepID=A0A166UUB8_9GAMM|nr:DUF3413 domain-containing protein [Pseudoalteromonas luteoviolacea]KZN30825.1 hypothetical protein N475_24145 [Pseudoalteromonas luteoviolacea DSM 6061]KZN53594.1 hypothetical protein N474_19875 [Pseudoalteromonas luteoviolacea CPMOR-2]MBE0386608.1 hypothetical protein [Pseudoalteromonas luteoviolacea DSM 6061]
MNLTPHSPFSSKASQLLSWGHWFTFANIGLVLVIALTYLAADSAPNSIAGWAYMLVTWLSHTSFITFCAFVLTVFPLSLVFPYPRHIRGMAAIIATLGILTLCLDAFVYYQQGYHISLQSLPEIVSLLVGMINGLSFATALFLILLVAAILTFELIVGNHAWRHLEQLKSYKFPRYATGVLVSCFAISHLMHVWADANNYFDITKQDNVLPLSYPTTAKTLLARHELLDLNEYQQARTVRLENATTNYQLPANLPACEFNAEPVEIVVLTEPLDTDNSLFSDKAWFTQTQLLVPTNTLDQYFNLVYGLPAYYRSTVTERRLTPVWNTANTLSISGATPFDYLEQDIEHSKVSFLFSPKMPEVNEDKNYIVIEKSIDKSIVAQTKLHTNLPYFSNHNGLMQGNDIMMTLLDQHFNCGALAQQTMLGNVVGSESVNQGVNYSQGVLIAYKKDRIILVNHDGSHKQISAKEGFHLDQKLDTPFLVQSIKRLKQFTGKASGL